MFEIELFIFLKMDSALNNLQRLNAINPNKQTNKQTNLKLKLNLIFLSCYSVVYMFGVKKSKMAKISFDWPNFISKELKISNWS